VAASLVEPKRENSGLCNKASINLKFVALRLNKAEEYFRLMQEGII